MDTEWGLRRTGSILLGTEVLSVPVWTTEGNPLGKPWEKFLGHFFSDTYHAHCLSAISLVCWCTCWGIYLSSEIGRTWLKKCNSWERRCSAFSTRRYFYQMFCHFLGRSREGWVLLMQLLLCSLLFSWTKSLIFAWGSLTWVNKLSLSKISSIDCWTDDEHSNTWLHQSERFNNM